MKVGAAESFDGVADPHLRRALLEVVANQVKMLDPAKAEAKDGSQDASKVKKARLDTEELSIDEDGVPF